MNAKFWAINVVAFLIIGVFCGSWIVGHDMNPFWEASPMEIVFMGAFFYLLTEGKLVQKVILAKRIKEEGTHREFSIIDKSSTKMDDTILDRFKKD